jgi:hypothetical protein
MTAPLSIYVLVDGLGWEVLRDRPFLDDLVAERRWLVTVLGGPTAALPSLLTGTLPSQHGRWPQRHAGDGAGRGSVTSLDAARAAAPVPSIFDDLRQAGIAYDSIPSRRGRDAELLSLAATRAATTTARVLFLHLGDLDADLREHLHDPAAVDAAVTWYERGIRRVFDCARRARTDVRLFVLSAYGLTPIRWTYDLRRDVQALGLREPDDVQAVYDPTMARFWVAGESVRPALMRLLDGHPCGTLMSPGELQRLGVWFEDSRYYELLFLMKPGMLLCQSEVAGTRPAAVAGYHPSEPTADGTLLSTVPVDKAVDHVTAVRAAILEDVELVTQEQAA